MRYSEYEDDDQEEDVEDEEGGLVYENDVEDNTLFDQYGDFRDQEAFEAYVEGYCPPWALAGEYDLDSLTVINVDDEIIHYELGADEEYLRDGCYLFDTNFEAAASEIWHFRRLLGPVPVGGTEDFDVQSRFISHVEDGYELAHESYHPETCDCPACHLTQQVADAEWWAEYLAKMTNDEFAQFVEDMQSDGLSLNDIQEMMDKWFAEAAEDPAAWSDQPETLKTDDSDARSQFTPHSDDFEPPDEIHHPDTCGCPACARTERIRSAKFWAETLARMTNDEYASFVDTMQASGVSTQKLQEMIDAWFADAAEDPTAWPDQPETPSGFKYSAPDDHVDSKDPESSEWHGQRFQTADELTLETYLRTYQPGWASNLFHDQLDVNTSREEDKPDEWETDMDEDPDEEGRPAETDSDDDNDEWEEDDEDWIEDGEDDQLFDQHGDFRDESAFASYFEGYEPRWADESDDDDDDDGTAEFEGDPLPF